ncbi:aa3-type cytochrome c oxidase subunit IV [Hansschlegelia beijingensis]|uniref:aa3-type cytochrome c oxidase subunit IV n=1 Tax=Hansschlegelia beijingensis TaxID=1133344 RepID=UPI003811BABA
MADHAVEYAAAPGNDYAEHERTYANFLKLSKVCTAAVVLIMIALAIGGVKGHWGLCGIGVLLAIGAGVIGAMTPKGSIVPSIVAGVVLLGLYVLFG